MTTSYPALSDRQCYDHFLGAVDRVSQRHWPVADRDFAQFLKTFEQQMQTEEELMFPALQKSLGTNRAPGADLRADHDHMRVLAKRTARALRARDAEEFFERATILRALMQQHRRKEAGIVHPLVDNFVAKPDTRPLPASARAGRRAPHGKRRAGMKAALALLADWVSLVSQPAGAATP
jgi:hypothetical protein